MAVSTTSKDKRIYSIAAIDGRYWKNVSALGEYLSEYGLMKQRVLVEVEYFIALLAILPKEGEMKESIQEDKKESEDKEERESKENNLRRIYIDFSEEDFEAIQKYERVTNHDVKAVEYFLKDKFDQLCLHEWKEWIHFAITSQDINNVAIPLMLRSAIKEIYLPNINNMVLAPLRKMADDWKDIPMLARTHGQAATPTRVGKELYVWVERLDKQLVFFEQPGIFQGKFGGAVGNFNAHVIAYPHIDWPKFADNFMAHLGLTRQQYTTQIAHYDDLAAIFDAMARINTILIDLSRDIWTYISMDYFKQKVKVGEVGSSTMPHKVNPIDFENAEGNLGIANALFSHFATKLPISRMQRDLSDSTVLRNIGLPIAHSCLAFRSLSNGFSKLILNQERIQSDLRNNWVVIAEAIQTVLRREGVHDSYELLKEFTRHSNQSDFSNDKFITFINSLPVSNDIKCELSAITPFNFIGVLPTLYN